MTNASALPAFPTAAQPPAAGGIGGAFQFYGLTKREYAAVEILKGLAASTPWGHLPSTADAVRLADNLFTKLGDTD